MRERRALVRGTFVVLSATALVAGLDALLAERGLAALGAGAFVLDAVGSRFGVGFAAPGAPRGATVRSLAFGAACGAGLATGVLALGWAVGAATVRGGSTTALGLLFALIAPLARAMRDEWLLRGLPCAIVGRRVGAPWLLAFGALASVARGTLEPTTAGLALALASGAFFTLLWLVARGGAAAFAAHASWRIVTSVLAAGSLASVTPSGAALALDGRAQGPLAWVAAVGFALATVAVARRARGGLGWAQPSSASAA